MLKKSFSSMVAVLSDHLDLNVKTLSVRTGSREKINLKKSNDPSNGV
jgi:hypothetical protein